MIEADAKEMGRACLFIPAAISVEGKRRVKTVQLSITRDAVMVWKASRSWVDVIDAIGPSSVPQRIWQTGLNGLSLGRQPKDFWEIAFEVSVEHTTE